MDCLSIKSILDNNLGSWGGATSSYQSGLAPHYAKKLLDCAKMTRMRFLLLWMGSTCLAYNLNLEKNQLVPQGGRMQSSFYGFSSIITEKNSSSSKHELIKSDEFLQGGLIFDPKLPAMYF